MRLIVGLGNPGPRYADNRHNIGFLAVDEIVRRYSFGPIKSKFHGAIAEGNIGSEKVICLCPTTFMNESGRAVQAALQFYKLDPSDITVIHDEIDLPLGKVKVKRGGGAGGHNGLRSIDAHIGPDYWRIRLGVGHPGVKAAVKNFVLMDFGKEERKLVDEINLDPKWVRTAPVCAVLRCCCMLCAVCCVLYAVCVCVCVCAHAPL